MQKWLLISHVSDCKDVGTPVMEKLDDINVAILSSTEEWCEAKLYGRKIRGDANFKNCCSMHNFLYRHNIVNCVLRYSCALV